MQGKERIEAALALLDVSCDRIDDAGCSPSAEEATLSSLPFEVLITIAADLLPAGGLSDTHAAWSAAMNFTSASHLTNAALVEAIRARIPVAIPEDWRFSPAGLCAHINSLLSGGGGRSKWRRLRPVQAVRAQSTHSVPVQAAPRLSGASLCRVAKERLVLYGGRDTASSDTLDHTHFATVRSGAVLWSKLLHSAHGPRPPARCYHTATALESDGPSAPHPMVVFGGAGEGDAGGENLLGDLWMLSVGADGAGGKWRGPLHPSGEPPAPRSSHICALWPSERALIFHGGLTSGGVRGDVYLLKGLQSSPAADGEWLAMQTSGVALQRAHHSGGVVNEATLLIVSGQDETLITRHTLASLDLCTWSWSSLNLIKPAARIDGACAAIKGVGLAIFGGVGRDFGFVPTSDAWLLRAADDVEPQGPLAHHTPPDASPSADGPCPRACLGLCADGLTIYAFGGFDGDADLNDLWALDLLHTADGAAPCNPSARKTANGIPGHALFDAAIFKARQSRACAVLHATPTFDDPSGTSIHTLVSQAWQMRRHVH